MAHHVAMNGQPGCNEWQIYPSSLDTAVCRWTDITPQFALVTIIDLYFVLKVCKFQVCGDL